MTFAELTTTEQVARVQGALRLLLGTDPSKLDYLALVGASQVVIDELTQMLLRYPLRDWPPDTTEVP